MTRFLLTTLAAAALLPAARAHFVFIVPGGPNAALVVLSDDLKPDSAGTPKMLAGTKLTLRAAGAKDAPLPTTPGDSSLKVEVPGAGPRVVFGTTDLGVMQRGTAKGFRLLYHPKAMIGSPDAALATLGADAAAEIVPVAAGGKVRFKVLAKGKPAAEVEVTVFPPEGENKKVTTDKDGLTPEFPAAGRYGAWARVVDPTPGKHDGKEYEAVRHYPTLVFDAAAPGLPPLPKAVSSLGAIASEGYVYVYGGHAGKTHSYDTQSVLGTFQRLKLDGGAKWEDLPAGPIAQGMNLAAHDGKIYRVGGMQPRNKPGDPSDNHSLADVARFDPKTNKWETLAPLPAGRSSHDVVTVGDKLVVVGGWQMKGAGEKSVWHETALVMDLTAAKPGWKSYPQPFQRRALTAAAVGTKVYVLGGLSGSATQPKVDVFDVATGQWSAGPALPGLDGRMAFSPAAGTVNGRLVVNTSAGPVFRLTASGDGWEKVGEAEHKRMVHRLVPLGPDAVVLVGGAGRGGNIDVVEIVKLAEQGEKVTAGGQ